MNNPSLLTCLFNYILYYLYIQNVLPTGATIMYHHKHKQRKLIYRCINNKAYQE